MRIKGILYTLLLACCFSAPVTGCAEEPTHQITAAQLTQLESIFQQLRTAQTEQEQQIETLRIQLTESETAIRQSQTSLQKANQSLQESAEEAKRTRDRLKRQRIIWGCVGLIAGFMMGKS